MNRKTTWVIKTCSWVLLSTALCACAQLNMPPTPAAKISNDSRVHGRLTLPAHAISIPAQALIEVYTINASNPKIQSPERQVTQRTIPLSSITPTVAFELLLTPAQLNQTDPYYLRAAVKSKAQVLFLSDAIALPIASNLSLEAPPNKNMDLKDIAMNLAFPDASLNGMVPIINNSRWLCGTNDVQMVLHNGEYGNLLLANQPAIAVKQATSASGARYVATDRSGTEFWQKGANAQVTVSGQSYPECILQGAGLAFPFKAFGNEPSWQLNLNAQKNTLEFMHNGHQVQLPYQQTDASMAANTYTGVSDTEQISVNIASKNCVDNMSGISYPYTVSVQAGLNMLKGCGGVPDSSVLP